MPKYSAPYKGCLARHISQGWNPVSHKALDIISPTLLQGKKGTPLTAPEDVKIIRISGETLTHDNAALKNGYGVYMRGLESGNVHLYWHSYPVFPVSVGQIVKRGQIVAFMSNSGTVYSGGVYVPLEERLDSSRGTHLHWEVMDNYLDGKKIRLHDFTANVDWNLQPTYSWLDHKLALARTITKGKQLLNQ